MSSNRQNIIKGAITFVSVNSDSINASKCELSQKSFARGQPCCLVRTLTCMTTNLPFVRGMSCRKLILYIFIKNLQLDKLELL